jgi:hypothetical protein
VLVGDEASNYGGSSPGVLESPLLRQYVDEVLAPELDDVRGALVVPLGVAVTGALDALADDGLIDPRRVLAGLPHPSGMNGSRLRTYERNRRDLAGQVADWSRGVADRRSARAAPPPHTKRTPSPRVPGRGTSADRHTQPPARSGRIPNAPLPDAKWFAELALRTIRALGGQITDRRTYYREGLQIGGFTPEQVAIPPPPAQHGEPQQQNRI